MLKHKIALNCSQNVKYLRISAKTLDDFKLQTKHRLKYELPPKHKVDKNGHQIVKKLWICARVCPQICTYYFCCCKSPITVQSLCPWDLNRIVKQSCSEIHSTIHWHEMFHDWDGLTVLFILNKCAFTKGSQEDINYFNSIICLGVSLFL